MPPYVHIRNAQIPVFQYWVPKLIIIFQYQPIPNTDIGTSGSMEPVSWQIRKPESRLLPGRWLYALRLTHIDWPRSLFLSQSGSPEVGNFFILYYIIKKSTRNIKTKIIFPYPILWSIFITQIFWLNKKYLCHFGLSDTEHNTQASQQGPYVVAKLQWQLHRFTVTSLCKH